MTDEEKIVKARETVAYDYTKEMLKDGWTATHTDYMFEEYDITATNGNNVVYLETKIRDYNTDTFKDKYAYVDVGKIENLIKLGKSAVIEFFWKNNAVYIWNTTECPNWEKKWKYTKKNSFTDEMVWKEVYLLPLDEAHRKYTIDITDYPTRFEQIMTKLDKYDE